MAINTIRGMSLLRVKMFPVEEVEAWFLFLQRCAEFLTEVRDPRIKNSMAYTLVEILIPVSIVIRLEVRNARMNSLLSIVVVVVYRSLCLQLRSLSISCSAIRSSCSPGRRTDTPSPCSLSSPCYCPSHRVTSSFSTGTPS